MVDRIVWLLRGRQESGTWQRSSYPKHQECSNVRFKKHTYNHDREDGLMYSSKLQTNRSNTLHPSKKWGPLWTEHGTGWTAQSAENWCPRNGTLPKTHKMQETHFGAGSERDCTNVGGIWNASKKMLKTMVKWHKIIHSPATPQSYKGNSFALRQGRYNVGHHKVHVAFQNKAWFAQVWASNFRLQHLIKTPACQLSPVNSHPSISLKQLNQMNMCEQPCLNQNPFRHKTAQQNLCWWVRRESLEVLPQTA